MSTMAHDRAEVASADAAARLSAGLMFAVVSAVSFGLAGALGRGLIETGWSAGAITLVRVSLGAAALTPFALAALRGRWGLLRGNLGLLSAYGVVAVAGAQFCYFSAVQHMQVGPAILIEFTAPAAVVVFLWLRHGQRPGRMTLAGAVLAALGLVLVLDLLSGADLSVRGVVWALGAMVGCATYFIISADERQRPSAAGSGLGRPPGRRARARAARRWSACCRCAPRRDLTTYAGVDLPWWAPLVLLGLVSAAVSYVAGIAAGRRLGSRLASFVALLEVLASVGWAWLLLHELPGAVQLRRRPADPGRRGRREAR